MRRAGEVVAGLFEVLKKEIKPGTSTAQIDRIAYEYITAHGCTPSFLNYNGFPASICASVNDEVVHGIPGNRVLNEGDIIAAVGETAMIEAADESHLHFEVILNGEYADPLNYLSVFSEEKHEN